ncbi:hypothetical protein PSTG_18553 [Puccinia striiformis f. sp. tritici PST-78]|uniref:Uncharacterized protein n=1 Tax=Puccinia striiformis f. sp. tritici PST-78 TaxID=1165861 RepID=A0A0L0ULW5_9BASI|nr:hypothetical protein PSTG_18553 [Puccinia striiformis f. sp. tritici PST-78]
MGSTHCSGPEGLTVRQFGRLSKSKTLHMISDEDLLQGQHHWVIRDLDDRPKRLQMLQMWEVSQTSMLYTHANDSLDTRQTLVMKHLGLLTHTVDLEYTRVVDLPSGGLWPRILFQYQVQRLLILSSTPPHVR